MKERPILFSAPMVRAILDGTKTQTRRTIKPQPNVTAESLRCPDRDHLSLSARVNEAWRAGFIPVRCPYGTTGDQLWVREHYTVAEVEGYGTGHGFAVFDDEWVQRDGATEPAPRELRPITGQKWGSHAGFHLPRLASRITLEVESVRAERVQDISEADAKAEGIAEPMPAHGKWCDPALGRGGHWSYRLPFSQLWDSINAARGHSWETNSWVWVISFRVLDAKRAAA